MTIYQEWEDHKSKCSLCRTAPGITIKQYTMQLCKIGKYLYPKFIATCPE